MKLSRAQLEIILKTGNVTVAKDSPYDPTRTAQLRPDRANNAARPAPTKSQSLVRKTLDAKSKVESPDSSGARVFVLLLCYRVRLQDRDNSTASGKALVDAMRYEGILDGDTEQHIELAVEQVKVKSFDQERVEILMFRFNEMEIEK